MQDLNVFAAFLRLKKQWAALAITMLFLSACSQSRTGLGRIQEDEIWRPVEICQNLSGVETRGCFEVELNITRNEAYVRVLALGFNPVELPYRILARRDVDNSFTPLADALSVQEGGLITIKARSKHFIEEYVEWRVESTMNFSFDGTNFEPASMGRGAPLAQVYIQWPELAVLQQ